MKKSVYGIAIALINFSCSKEQIEIPFSYERNIYIKSVINDSINGNIMFDTGAFGLYLDSTYNSRPSLGYNYFNPDNLGSAGHLMLKFAIDGNYFTLDRTQIINAKPTFGKQCDGIVGWDLLKDYSLEIDYINTKLKLMKDGGIANEDGYTKIPLIFRNNMFFVNMDVKVSDNLTVSGEYLLDLGYGGSVYFTGETVRKYQIDTIASKKVEFGVDWGLTEKRKSVGFAFRGKSIKIDEFELIDPTIECSKDLSGVLSGGEYIGLLGNRSLEHFDVVIDFVNKELYLKPNADYKKRMKFRTIGVGFVDRTDICNGFIVNSFYSTSQVDKIGIMSGDIITHFDGEPVKTNSEKMIKDFYDNVGKDVEVTFLRKDSIFKLNMVVKEEL